MNIKKDLSATSAVILLSNSDLTISSVWDLLCGADPGAAGFTSNVTSGSVWGADHITRLLGLFKADCLYDRACMSLLYSWNARDRTTIQRFGYKGLVYTGQLVISTACCKWKTVIWASQEKQVISQI